MRYGARHRAARVQVNEKKILNLCTFFLSLTAISSSLHGVLTTLSHRSKTADKCIGQSWRRWKSFWKNAIWASRRSSGEHEVELLSKDQGALQIFWNQQMPVQSRIVLGAPSTWHKIYTKSQDSSSANTTRSKTLHGELRVRNVVIFHNEICWKNLKAFDIV